MEGGRDARGWQGVYQRSDFPLEGEISRSAKEEQLLQENLIRFIITMHNFATNRAATAVEPRDGTIFHGPLYD